MSQGMEIRCGEAISNTITDSIHEYTFKINNTFNVIFDTCGSIDDVRINVYDELNTIVSDVYCIGIYGDNDNYCGYCNNGGKNPENFTVSNMLSGIYSISITPFNVSDNPSYNLAVTCIEYTNSTNAPQSTEIYTTFPPNYIYCNDTIHDTIHNTIHSYHLIINNPSTVTFDTCQSVGDVVVFVWEGDRQVSDAFCVGGDDCGFCANGQLYAEHFTIPLMLPVTYIVDILPFSTDYPADYSLHVSCVPIQNMTFQSELKCNDTISNTITKGSHDYLFIFDQTYDITFDFFGSKSDIRIDIYEDLYNQISDQYCDKDCYGNKTLTIPKMHPGVYRIKISGYGNNLGSISYNFTVSCTVSPLYCDDTVSAKINKNELHVYSFIIDTRNTPVTFDTCESIADVVINVYDNNGTDISNAYCNQGDDCGNCDGQLYMEYFTIPSVIPGNYTITVAPYPGPMSDSFYDLTITCGAELASHLSCGDTIFNKDLIVGMNEYELTIYDETNVTFDTCTDSDDVVIHVFDNLNKDISDPYCTDGNYCGNCTNQYPGEENKGEHFTIPYMSPGKYVIVISLYPDYSYWRSHYYKLSVTCTELELHCGDTISNVSMTAGLDEYKFTASYPQDVIFDSCGNVSINVYHQPSATLIANDFVCDGGEHCVEKCNNSFAIPYIPPSTYRVKITSINSDIIPKYNLSITCATTPYIWTSGAYISWWNANIACKRMFNTTLATPKTTTDWDRIYWQSPTYFTVAWIGLYNNFSSGSKWHWADGSICEYSDINRRTLLCDDLVESLPTDEIEFIKPNQAKPLYAYYTKTNKVQYEEELNETNKFTDLYYGFKRQFICDADEPYTPNCEKIQNCWMEVDCCDDDDLHHDIESSQNQNRAPVVYWNNTLYAIGWQKIHYTEFKLGNNQYQWNHMFYDEKYWDDHPVPIFNVDYINVLSDSEGMESHLYQRYLQYASNASDFLYDLIVDNPLYDYWPTQQYAQYKSSLYLYYPIYFQAWEGDLLETVFLHIDLNTLNITYINTPGDFVEDVYAANSDQTIDELDNTCLVADYKNVYVIKENTIEIYHADIHEWDVQSSVIQFDLEYYVGLGQMLVTAACAITNDFDYIYIFDYSTWNAATVGDAKLIEQSWRRNQIMYNWVIKYGIQDKKSFTLDYQIPPNLWWTQSSHAVTAGNGKIYLHGGYISWQTAIFNPKTERFETETININGANTVKLYDDSRLAKYDDNVLLLLSIESISQMHFYSVENIRLYSTITDLVSINFTDTELISKIWPSEGFSIKYYLNDFSNITTETYYVNFEMYFNVNNTEDTNENYVYDEIIQLIISNDDCICEINIYNSLKCQKCQQHFDLNQYSQVFDTTANTLNIVTFESKLHNIVPLIIPQDLTINLERCTISFKNVGSVSDTDDPTARFNYSFETPQCYSRSEATFSVLITSSIGDFEKEMSISIHNNNNKSVAQICDINMENNNVDRQCDAFDTNYFEIKHSLLKDDHQFYVMFKSNSFDVIVDQDSKSVSVQFKLINSLSLLEKMLIILGSITVFICFLTIFGWQYKKIWDEKQKRKKYEHKIYNPMVVSIGIAFYNDLDIVENPGVNMYCRNLDGINRDYENIKELCRQLNYDLYPESEKYEWTQNEILDFLEKRAADIGGDNKNNYDSIMLVVSCHGYDSNIITSDYQLISKSAVHRIFSTNFPSVRELPRIYIFDCCDGGQERSYNPANYAGDSDSDTVDEAGKTIGNVSKNTTTSTGTKDQGKNFDVDDIKINQYEEELWKHDQANPDYKVSIINAANEGFQAKMNSLDGSYLIYQFASRMIKNTESGNKKERLYFGEIIDGIQQYLHDSGKQQIIATYNNHTRYVKFEKNAEILQEDDDSVEGNVNGNVEKITNMIELAQTKKEQNVNGEEESEFILNEEDIDGLIDVVDEIDPTQN